MAIPKTYTNVWHIGETATPFSVQMVDANGDARTDVASATFTLINRDTGVVIIDSEACQSVTDGKLTYRPSSEEMQTPCRFLAQFEATLLVTGQVEPKVLILGEIEANL